MTKRFFINVFYISVIISALISCESKHSYTYVDEIESVYKSRDGGEFSDAQIEQIFSIIEKNPESLNQDMTEPSNITSDDGNLRAYTIERSNFGGNPTAGFEIHTLFQYRIGDKIGVTSFDEVFTDVKSISHLGNNKYLVIDEIAVYHQGDYCTMTAKVVEITNSGVVIDRHAFVDGKKKSEEIVVKWSEEDCEVDYIADGMKAHLGENEQLGDRMLYYNAVTKQLFVNNTVKTVNGNSHVSESYKRYDWDGSVFVNTTIMKPIEARSDDYYIRIEQLADGSCVYKCWNRGQKRGEPNLTIRGGQRLRLYDMMRYKYDEWFTDDCSTPDGEECVFENNGYSYKFTYSWPRISEGNVYGTLSVENPDGDEIFHKLLKIVAGR